MISMVSEKDVLIMGMNHALDESDYETHKPVSSHEANSYFICSDTAMF